MPEISGRRLLHALSHYYPLYTGPTVLGWFLWALFVQGEAEDVPLATGCTMLANPVVSHLLKAAIKQPRPQSSDHGMPSAHAFWAAGLSVTLLLAARECRNRGAAKTQVSALQRTALLTSVAALLVAVERVLTRAHTAAQSVAGLALGTLYTVMVWRYAMQIAGPLVGIIRSLLRTLGIRLKPHSPKA